MALALKFSMIGADNMENNLDIFFDGESEERPEDREHVKIYRSCNVKMLPDIFTKIQSEADALGITVSQFLVALAVKYFREK